MSLRCVSWGWGGKGGGRACSSWSWEHPWRPRTSSLCTPPASAARSSTKGKRPLRSTTTAFRFCAPPWPAPSPRSGTEPVEALPLSRPVSPTVQDAPSAVARIAAMQRQRVPVLVPKILIHPPDSRGEGAQRKQHGAVAGVPACHMMLPGPGCGRGRGGGAAPGPAARPRGGMARRGMNPLIPES